MSPEFVPYSVTPGALEVLDRRYYCKTAGETTPDHVWRRASLGAERFYRLMADGLFFPNSPTLFNAGTDHGGTLSACFVFNVSDSLNGDWPGGGKHDTDPNSIMGTAFKASCVAKAGGGVGYYLGNVRPKGALVKSVHRKACGPVAVLHYLHGLRNLITQGGKRDLAQMGILPASHPDVFDFIHCKDDDPKALESFNISLSWRDEEVRAALGIGRPADPKWQKIWDEQVASAWKTGDPGMFFRDAVNRANATPHLGDVEAPNPCGETPNLNNEPCNLGSLALLRFVDLRTRTIVWDKLEAAVIDSIDFLDHILDNNVFPHPDITAAALATRKLGLGVMGWADMLALMKIPYDSAEAVDLAHKVMEFVNRIALMTSILLAKHKEPYPAWESAPDEVKARFPKARNSTRTSIAPTGTIALFANCMSSIEPHFALEWERKTNEGIRIKEHIAVRDYLDGFVPKTADQVSLGYHVQHQAAFQKHTDLGVSKTINLPNSATLRDVNNAYRMMWELGCKGGTVFRDGCRDEQVLRATKTSVYANEAPANNGPPQPVERKMPQRRVGETVEARIGGFAVYLTMNKFEDGTLGEVWLKVAKNGSSLNGMNDAWAIQFSKSLQFGVPLERMVKWYSGIQSEPNGITGDPVVPICTSIPDYVVRRLAAEFLVPKDPNVFQARAAGPIKAGTLVYAANAALPAGVALHDQFPGKFELAEGTTHVMGAGPVPSGHYCPECNRQLYREAGCLSCPPHAGGCGFYKCG